MFKPPKAGPPPKIQRIHLKDWMSGTISSLDDGRTGKDGLRSGANIILSQNGTVRPRPSLVPYGPSPLGAILGELFEFRKVTGLSSTNWLMCIQLVSGVANLYVAKGEDTAWTKISGKDYHTSARAHFVQIDNRIIIANGEDTLSYFDIANEAIVSYTSLTNPSAPTLNAQAGLTGTTFKVYYAITANSTVGETAGSPVLSQAVSTDRDLWNPETQSVTIEWSAVTNAKSYNVYMGISADGAGAPELYLIASGVDASNRKFSDNGTRAQDLSRPLPSYNNTAGPRATRGDVAAGRLWLVGDKDKPYFVWRGGDIGHEVDFSPANGGGFMPVGSGTKEVPISVRPYRDGKGSPMVMVLSQGTNGSGKRFLLSPEVVSVGGLSATVWRSQEDAGQDGTDSPDGVIIYNNSLWYPSRDGFKTTGTVPQLQNVLTTNRVSASIQDSISTLRTDSMHKCVGLAYEGRLYWALPVNSSDNSEIWVLDLDRKGAWMRPWNVAASWMTLYNDNSGRTHFLIVKDDKIYELNKSSKTNDDGKAIPTSGTSGQVGFSEDKQEWGRVIAVIFRILRPQGQINFNVSGMTEDGVVAQYQSEEFAVSATRAGWSEPGVGWSAPVGWSGVGRVPTAFNPAVEEVVFELDEDYQWLQYGWDSTSTGVDYDLSDVVIEYVNVGIKDLR